MTEAGGTVRVVRTIAAAALAVTLAACGSTAQVGLATNAGGTPAGTTPGQDLAAGTDDGLTLSTEDVTSPGTDVAAGQPGSPGGQGTAPGPVGPAAGGSGGAPPAPRPGAPPAAGGPGPAAPGTSGPAPPPPAAAGQGNAAGVRGVTDTEIRIGFELIKNAAAFNAALGINIGQSNGERTLEILLADINQRGGIAGRKVVPVPHYRDAQSASTIPQQEQAECATWTDDNEVFAAVFGAGATDTLRQCLANAGVEMIAGSLSSADDQTFASFPYAEPHGPSLTRVARAMAGGLAGLGYYEPEVPTGARIGLMRFGTPQQERAAAVLREALAGIGLQVDREVAVKYPDSNQEIGGSIAEIQSAVLRFKAEGIDHVLMFDSSGGMAIFFMTAAENQNYRPQYGLTSNNGNQLLVGVVPEGQLQNALSLGWLPIADVRQADDPGLTPPGQRCVELMEANGQQASDRNALGQQLIACDRFNALAAALDPALGPVGPGRLMVGIERLGTSFTSTIAFSTEFGPGRRDGAGGFRGLTFFDDCSCFKYTTPPQPF